MRVHHTGYLVKNIEKAEVAFSKLGYSPCGEIIFDSHRGIDVLFMLSEDGKARIELVSPSTDDSVVTGLMEKFKNAPYHMCYESDDFENDLDLMRSMGFTPVDEPAPAPAIDGKRIAYFTNRYIGFVELVDMKGFK